MARHTLLDHQGNPLSGDIDLFEPPPPSIGKPISAYSTLKKPGNESWWTRIHTIVASIIVSGLLGFGLAHYAADGRQDYVIYFLFAILPTFLCGFAAARLSRFNHTCTYIGHKGIALFKCSKRRDNITRSTICLFENADSLTKSITHQYINGLYYATTYHYEWEGRDNFKLKGDYYKKKPRASNNIFFLTAAETVWTMHLLQIVQAKLNSGETYTFPYWFDERNVVLSLDWIEFQSPKKNHRCYRGELASVHVQKGDIVFQRVGAKAGWLTSEGIYTYSADITPNAQALVILAQHYVAG